MVGENPCCRNMEGSHGAVNRKRECVSSLQRDSAVKRKTVSAGTARTGLSARSFCANLGGNAKQYGLRPIWDEGYFFI